MSTIGEEIKNRRKELQISQQDIADLAGIGINTLVAIERGTGNPSLKTLTAVLDALGFELHCQPRKLNNIPTIN